MMSAPVVMALVAAAAGLLAIVVVSRPGASEAARYAKRIAGTMLGAGAVILGGFAYALSGWGAGK